MVVEQRFGVLRFISAVLRVLAWLALLLGLIAAVSLLLNRSPEMTPDGMMPALRGGAGAAIVSFLVGLFYFIVLYAWAEVILVFVEIEQHTRATAGYLAQAWETGGPGALARPVAAEPLAERPVVERRVVETAPAERPVVERQVVEPAPAERPVVERPVVEERPVPPAAPPAAPPAQPPPRPPG